MNGWIAGMLLVSVAAQEGSPPTRWRGFHLLEKFTLERNRPFREEDFRLIAEWGFNYARLPLDYRIWARGPDARGIDEAALREIDAAVEYGRRTGVHVALNFHRAPGWCVNPPAEPRSLWTDPEVLETCARHWAAFARRYREVPPERLSFNLLNEPADVAPELYERVVRALAEAIRREDPRRPIVADGLKWGTVPVPELAPLGVGQSLHHYRPFRLTHYRAPWVAGSNDWPEPTWPERRGLSGMLYGPDQGALHGPLLLRGRLEGPFTIRVKTVSRLARLVVRADGAVVLDRRLVSGPERGEAREVVWKEELKVYQNHFDRDYTAPVPEGTREVSIEVAEGDWMSFSRLRIGTTEVIPADFEWGRRPEAISIDARGRPDFSIFPIACDRDTLARECIGPWKALQAKGVPVHVGEIGVYRRTPHEAALAWLDDSLALFQEAGWGWALWELRGAFGVLDSGREDVAYEDFRGRKLDRRMLEILRRR